MKKNKALEHIKDKMGYVPYYTLYQHFNDEDEIPKELIDLSLERIKVGDFILINPNLAKILGLV